MFEMVIYFLAGTGAYHVGKDIVDIIRLWYETR
jgi:hypothetical protein